ncbi:hypothetical protein BDFB_001428 [Asbolus verrucosus]|uniref:Uncharacterized protein n=1 Tax=Asbolus verrucosus TaxID=1661398 RepID=A0A482W977_ASBVE|nr:hypothetical protein BDFB_001428 [Asbolus verrucosus]
MRDNRQHNYHYKHTIQPELIFARGCCRSVTKIPDLYTTTSHAFKVVEPSMCTIITFVRKKTHMQ